MAPKLRIVPSDLTPAEQAEALRQAARGKGMAALKVLEDIMSDPGADHKVRITAASAMLDRGFGKPSQSVEQTHNVTDLSAQHLEALRALSVGGLHAVNAPSLTIEGE
jgi:hypothetical protein